MTITLYCSVCDSPVSVDESELSVNMYCPYCMKTTRFEAPLIVASSLTTQQKCVIERYRTICGDALRFPKSDIHLRGTMAHSEHKRLSDMQIQVVLSVFVGICTIAFYLLYGGDKRNAEAVSKEANCQTDDTRVIQQRQQLPVLTKPKESAKAHNATSGALPTFTGNDHLFGDVFIPKFPMVDQGRLPWCSVASAARVLKYYGHPCDMNRLAQIFGTDNFGTAESNFRNELPKIASAYGLVFRQVIGSQVINNRTVEAYNRRARDMYRPILDEANFTYWKGNQKFFDGEKFTYALDYDVWRAIHIEDDARYNAFCDGVENAINSKTPLIWQVYLGLDLNERKVQGKTGTHTRIIIGYNAERMEIIYTDSWGRSHAKKRMPLEAAYLSTRELMTISRR